jgi:hypothetical protein
VHGIPNAVDLDVFNGSLAQLQGFGGGPDAASPPMADAGAPSASDAAARVPIDGGSSTDADAGSGSAMGRGGGPMVNDAGSSPGVAEACSL